MCEDKSFFPKGLLGVGGLLYEMVVCTPLFAAFSALVGLSIAKPPMK